MEIKEGSNVTISHLGVIAGLIDQLQICECIDGCLPKTRPNHVSHGLAVKALLLNCLGFTERRLYILPEFFEDVATERLLGSGIKPEHLNQYLFGETLDKIAEFGPTVLFNTIIIEILKILDLGVLRLHHDTTTINVTGEYEPSLNTRLIELVRGHSKDHRDDLNQFVLALCTDQRGIPLFMESLSGNASDKKTLLKMVNHVRENLDPSQIAYHMADSAFFTAENIQYLDNRCLWITKVPETLNQAKEIVSSDVVWSDCMDSRYRYAAFESSYAGVPQRWILYYSADMHKKKVLHDQKKITKDLARDQTALNKLLQKDFACEKDAILTIERWIAKHPRYLCVNQEMKVVTRKKSGKRGRPAQNEDVEQWIHVTCTLGFNEEVICREREKMGRFILASNDLTIDPDTCLEYYKEQSSVERGFRFLKSDSFHVSEIYLENGNRIAALSMIMVLCLLIYSLAEWMVRTALKKNNSTIRNQMKKPTQKPTAKWIFYLFRRVREIGIIVEGKHHTQILNYTDELQNIAKFFGRTVEKYYF